MLSYPIAADEIKCSTARWGFDFPYEKLVAATAEDWRAAARLDERHDLILQSAAQEAISPPYISPPWPPRMAGMRRPSRLRPCAPIANCMGAASCMRSMTSRA
ncbi:hypothetical protein [Phenylobacterium aquaticum]|uniref:hypothetical protein n=1 Tax=Phenylobacterium aquaticum TaxID=1763816 RepID=UPI001F5D0268|nr:hypothetical protein [Phenylobacterium aquaticum]MCI3134594.1 hypothetical protein [Phenylobacterium aquaticum]